LNYDILIDNAITKSRQTRDVDLEYGVEFTNFSRERNWQAPRSERAISLLKLHGSLNWLYCPTCISLTLTPEEKGIIQLKWQPQDCVCPDCNTLTTPIVIPPTFFKVMDNFYLQKIWREAEKSFTQAKRLVFCGYSFPDADIHIKYLLKRVEVNRNTTPEIYIVNNHPKKSKHQKNEEEVRYKRFFRDQSKVHYTKKSFQNFCKSAFDCF
jgi:NAD-dependent SIR2 family protein deacetylase